MVIGVTNKVGDRGVLQLAGPFDFRCILEFKGLYDPFLKDADIASIEINMSGVDYIDNTAFGMLLALRDKAAAVRKKIVLGECHGMTRKMLDMAHFGKLFEIL